MIISVRKKSLSQSSFFITYGFVVSRVMVSFASLPPSLSLFSHSLRNIFLLFMFTGIYTCLFAHRFDLSSSNYIYFKISLSEVRSLQINFIPFDQCQLPSGSDKIVLQIRVTSGTNYCRIVCDGGLIYIKGESDCNVHIRSTFLKKYFLKKIQIFIKLNKWHLAETMNKLA